MQRKTLIVVPNGKVWASRQQADAIEALIATRKGGFARLYGYKPQSNYEVPPVQDILMVTRFSMEKLYARRKMALANIRFDDVAAAIAKEPKLAALSRTEQEQLFNDRLRSQIDSLEKTESGDRSDPHRQGHDRCYLRIADGIKVHYVTEKGNDGLMHPVLTDGFPTVASIMIVYLENSKVTRAKGIRKTVNSRPSTLMGSVIEGQLNARSVGIRTASLKDGNFERLVIDHEVILTEDIASLV